MVGKLSTAPISDCHRWWGVICPCKCPLGCPPGSVLGPLLFLLYINGVTEVVTSNCALSLYADDNLLFCEIIELRDYTRVQDNINLVHAWFLEWFMEFNISKCKFMVISKKRQDMAHLSNSALMALVSRG